MVRHSTEIVMLVARFSHNMMTISFRTIDDVVMNSESGIRGISILSLIPSRIENEGLKSTFSLIDKIFYSFSLQKELL